MKYLSLFAGIGGFELGIEQAYENRSSSKNKRQGLQRTRDQKRQSGERTDGSTDGLTCVGYSEIDKYATQIYERHFNHKQLGDITEIDGQDLPEFECMVGGFPCQSFSIAGNRGGFNDTRGTLFFDIARLAQQRQPRLLVLENVKGLLSHDEGRTFRTVINTLDELGYDIQWQVLNSKYHGVPQNRERVFIIGHLRGTPRPEIFPIGGGGGKPERIQPEAEEKRQGFQGESQKRGRNNGRSKGGGQSEGRLDSGRIRKLTPTECERLQGFPDGWTEYGIDEDGNEVEISDTQRYKTLGNAVTVNVVQHIFENLRAKNDER